MAQIISVVNQKGGEGKTTTAVNLGAYLAALGKFVLLVDLDPQANATSGLGVDHRKIERGVYEALLGEASVRGGSVPTRVAGGWGGWRGCSSRSRVSIRRSKDWDS